MQVTAYDPTVLATAVQFSMLAVRLRQGADTPGVPDAATGSRRGINIG
jgi:hypothetical protein